MVCVCVRCGFLPDQVVIAYKHQVLQYGEEIGLCTAVLHHALHNTEYIPCISAESQGSYVNGNIAFSHKSNNIKKKKKK